MPLFFFHIHSYDVECPRTAGGRFSVSPRLIIEESQKKGDQSPFSSLNDKRHAYNKQIPRFPFAIAAVTLDGD